MRRSARIIASLALLALLAAPAGAQTPLCRTGAGGPAQCAGQLGSAVLFHLPSGTTWTAGRYLGISGETPAVTAVAGVVPWCAPAKGTARYLTAQGVAGLSPGSTLTAYKSSSGALSFSATSFAVTVPLFSYAQQDTTHSLALLAGDCLVFSNDTTWFPGGLSLTFVFVPT